ncbi:MAG: aminotransferase class III-fold pyridoxal phosphate-dependent enzyme [Planctomycetes bacterium]|nr:aminotransferase class III-fold pyridoxal phosphate-dependent enzyme [Planctomycetota bacterium]
MHLTDTDIERIFSSNARQLLGITPKPTGEKVQALYREAKKLIPGGTQLLSKRPEMFAPDQWPAYYEQAIGCEVIDTEGRKFIDMSYNSVGACLLGYADPDVNAAVIRRVQLGSVSVLNSPDEVELAKLLTTIHPWAQQVRYTRAGGEALAVAARIARAATGRETLAVCGYHGWSDWYLAANLGSTESLNGHLLPGLSPTGVPASLSGSCLTFNYNKLDEIKRIFDQHGPKLAAVIMEPTRSVDPAPGFLEGIREMCDKHGAKLVFDEVSIGWRMRLGGAHLLYGVTPDVAVFAKALGNGFPIAAVLGKAATMEAAQASFISSSFWTEGVGPAAGVAAVKKMMRIDVPAHVKRIGERVRAGWLDLAKRHSLPLTSTGHVCWAGFAFTHPDAAALTTLFTVRMLTHGFLAGSGFYPMLTHEDRHADAYLAACDTVFAELAAAIRAGDVRQRIGGPVKHTGFARLA